MKAGRVVILLAGRRAGKKAVIVKQYDEGKKGKTFGHALVAGVERCPLKVTKKMSVKRIEKRSKLKPFVKFVNYNHILPTRF
jgi:large subunit ribosomal protein L27e